MNRLFLKHHFISDFHFFVLTVGLWFALLGPIQLIGPLQIIFLTCSGILSLAMLKAFESIDALRVSPRFTNVFVMTLAFLAGAFETDLILQTVLRQSIPGLSTIVLKSIPVAIGIFAMCRVLSLIMLHFDRKKRVVLNVTPAQRSTFIADLAPLKLDSYLRFLSRGESEEFAARRGFREIDMIIISREAVDFQQDAFLLRAHLAGVPIHDLHTVTNRLTGHVRLAETDLSTFVLGATHKSLTGRMLLRSKYLFEPVVAFLMMVALAPVMAMVALLIKILSPGPVFYRQRRLGYLGKEFGLIKFRTMVTNAEQDGPKWASRNDPRVTPFGKFLRRTRLDELPQLWNVLRGEMSFIGPRPERPEIYKQLEKEVPLFHLRTLVRPGITGWAQVRAGYAASAAESWLKLEYDLFYIQHMSLRFDLCILVRTLKTVFVGDQVPQIAPSMSPIAGMQTSKG